MAEEKKDKLEIKEKNDKNTEDKKEKKTSAVDVLNKYKKDSKDSSGSKDSKEKKRFSWRKKGSKKDSDKKSEDKDDKKSEDKDKKKSSEKTTSKNFSSNSTKATSASDLLSESVGQGGLKSDSKKQKKQRAPKLEETQTSKREENAKHTRRENPEKKRKRNRAIGVCVMCVAVFVLTVGCFSIAGAMEINGGIAARVDDYRIMEKDVTNYITHQTYYANYAKDKQKWQQMLSMYGTTPESFREQVINSKFVHDELVRIGAEQEGITVDQAKVDEKVNELKSKYKNTDAYNAALQKMGYTEETYRQSVEQQLLEEQLKEKVAPKKEVSDADLANYINTNKSTYKDAKKSSHILFNSNEQEQAQQVLNQINSGQISFEDAAKQYSKDSATAQNGGDLGWDKLASSDNATLSDKDYTTALGKLEPGQVSELVKTSSGYQIIKCTDKWATPDTVSSLSGIPQEIVNKCREKKAEEAQTESFNTWLDNMKNERCIKVEIFDMPLSVPYYVEVSSTGSGLSSSAATTTTTTTK